MDNLIERYVYDVTRRLPEKEREDVKRELTANIFDMLPDEPSEEAVKGVLCELGNPAKLAEKYRQTPRYLISPAMYDIYVRALKMALPLGGAIFLIVGVVLGIVDMINGSIIITEAIPEIIERGLSTALDVVIQIFLWVTIGFAIAERVNKSAVNKNDDWKIADLPHEVPGKKSRIPLSDGIVDLVVTTVLSILAVIVCTGIVPVILFYTDNKTFEITSLLNADFMKLCIPAIIISAVFGIGESIFKIIYRRWNVPVCCSVIANNLVGLGATLFILTRPNILSNDFVTLVQTNAEKWNIAPLINFLEESPVNPIIVFLCASVTLGIVIGCITAIVKTVKAKKA